MTKFIKVNLLIILGVAISIYSHTSSSQVKKDFLRKYDLYYFDNSYNFTKNGKILEKGGDTFTPDILYTDGSYLSSYSDIYNRIQKGKTFEEARKTTALTNNYKLYFQGNIYESYQGSEYVLRDKNYIYYLKCMNLEYNKRSDRNCCVKTALYANNVKIDEADIVGDILISVGFSNINPLFVKNGILYYVKTIGNESNLYSYEPKSKNIALYKPDLFYKNNNELLAILDNGDVVFGNSAGIFKNDFQSKFIDTEQIGFSLKGFSVGNDYYHRDMGHTEQENYVGYNFYKNNMLAAKINSDTYGEMIDAEKQACNFGNFICGYSTLMYCIHKEGTIVRLDKRTNEKTIHTGQQPPYTETDVAYFVNNDVIDFSKYWTIGENKENSILLLSFVFDVKGNVSSLIVNAYDKNMLLNIYLVQYFGEGRIGSPEILVSNATLFGAIKKLDVK